MLEEASGLRRRRAGRARRRRRADRSRRRASTTCSNAGIARRAAAVRARLVGVPRPRPARRPAGADPAARDRGRRARSRSTRSRGSARGAGRADPWARRRHGVRGRRPRYRLRRARARARGRAARRRGVGDRRRARTRSPSPARTSPASGRRRRGCGSPSGVVVRRRCPTSCAGSCGSSCRTRRTSRRHEVAGPAARGRRLGARGALVSGPTGLEAIEAIVAAAPAWLEPDGVLVLELAPHQAERGGRRSRRGRVRRGVRVRHDLTGRTGARRAPAPRSLGPMADGDQLDVDAMLARFRERAEAVQGPPLPPVAGPSASGSSSRRSSTSRTSRSSADADWAFDDGVLTLTVDLRPPEARLGPERVRGAVGGELHRPALPGFLDHRREHAGITAVREGAPPVGRQCASGWRSSGRCRGRTPPTSTRRSRVPS